MSDRGSLANLKQEIVENIMSNENQAITGDLLQDVLVDCVDTMGVSVSQNTDTGGLDINIGSDSYNIASQDEISVPPYSDTKTGYAGAWYPYNFIKGHRYRIKNTGDVIFSAATSTVEVSGTYVDTIGEALPHSYSPTITATENALYLFVGSTTGTPCTFTLEDVSTVENRIEQIIDDAKIPLKYMRGLSDAVWARNSVNLTNDEIQSILELINKSIDKVECVFWDGYITISKFELTSTLLKIGFYCYDSPSTTYTQSDFDSHTKFEIAMGRGSLLDFSYAGQSYTNKAIRIKFTPDIIAWMDSLVSGETIKYDATSSTSVSRLLDGFKPENVTNKEVWNNNTSMAATEQTEQYKTLFLINEAVKDIKFVDSPNFIIDIRRVALTNNVLGLTFAYCENSGDNTISNAKTNYQRFDAEYEIKTDDKVVTLPFNYYNAKYVYVTLDISALADIQTIMTPNLDGAYLSPFVLAKSYEYVTPKFVFAGYCTDTLRQASAGYNTYIVPLNKECSIATVFGTFDKRANVAVAAKNGVLLKWGITDAGGGKYSGDADVTSVTMDVAGYKYLVISTRGDLNGLQVIISGFDSTKAIDSYSSLAFADLYQPHNIHLMQATNTESGIVSSAGRDINSVPDMETESLSFPFTDTETGFVYETSALLDARGDTRYFISNPRGIGTVRYNAVLWKQTGETNTVLLRHGEVPPIDFETYPEYDNATWFISGAAAPYQGQAFIKALSDGELLIGVPFSKDIAADRTDYFFGIFRTAGGQRVWIPKFVTSNAHDKLETEERYKSTYGYPTKNNSIHIVKTYDVNLILISEYGSGTLAYWREREIPKNGNGLSGKVWMSLDNGVTFKKIFDLDEKINGDASDISDDNWKWCDSYAGRMSMHIHGCYVDLSHNMVWITNGDVGSEGGKDSLFYANLGYLISWYINYGIACDAHELYPTYTDNEVLPDFNEYVIHRYITNGITCFSNILTNSEIQMYCFYATHNMLLLGHDCNDDSMFCVHSDCINSVFGGVNNNVDCPEIFVDKLAKLSNMHTSFPQSFVRRDENSPILMLEYYALWASWDGANWKEKLNFSPNEVGFLSYFVKDIDGKYVIVSTSNLDSNVNIKLLNY